MPIYYVKEFCTLEEKKTEEEAKSDIDMYVWREDIQKM